AYISHGVRASSSRVGPADAIPTISSSGPVATTTTPSGSSISKRSGHRPAGSSGTRSAVKDLLQALDLGGELSLESRADVRLEDKADPRAKSSNGLAGSAHDVHALVPGALDRGEHRVGVVGQA